MGDREVGVHTGSRPSTPAAHVSELSLTPHFSRKGQRLWFISHPCCSPAWGSLRKGLPSNPQGPSSCAGEPSAIPEQPSAYVVTAVSMARRELSI